ncbi:MAG: F0F1 ATP synthase subunit A [Candidatus Gastranaerophilales bacterium]|nr:F0F1 ATP synthase subunit A [Candidatus Gastranaerophilales bacterium]
MHIGHHWTVEVLGMNVHMDTLITLWIVMAIIILFAAVAVGRIKLVPSKLQAVFENIVKIFSGLTKDMGDEGKRHTPLLLTLFLLIITSNLIGQIPWKLLNFIPSINKLGAEFASPTNDINVTAALAITVLLYYIISGIRVKGISYFKHYFQPIWFMTPFNMLEDIVRPLTLSLRLFANILAGEILILVLGTLIASLLDPTAINAFCQNTLGGILPGSWVYNISLFLGSLLPLPIMFFELFVAFVQALVFTLLANAYIQGAVAKHH